MWNETPIPIPTAFCPSANFGSCHAVGQLVNGINAITTAEKALEPRVGKRVRRPVTKCQLA